MTCLKTGCDIFLVNYGAFAHGDLHKVGNCLIFHHCGVDHTALKVADKYVYGWIRHDPESFEREAEPYNVLVIPANQFSGNDLFVGDKHWERSSLGELL